MRRDFRNIDIFSGSQNGPAPLNISNDAMWETAEHINVKPVYTSEDLKEMEHLDYAAGIPPYLRGPYSMMYTFRPWTIRQYAGFSTAESPTHSPAVTLHRYRRDCRWHSTFPHTEATTPTTNVLRVTSVKPEFLYAAWRIWSSCSTVFHLTRCRYQ